MYDMYVCVSCVRVTRTAHRALRNLSIMYDCFVSGGVGGDVCGLSCYNPNPEIVTTRIIHVFLFECSQSEILAFTLRQTTLLLKVRGEQCRLIESTGTRIRPHYDFDLGSFHT